MCQLFLEPLIAAHHRNAQHLHLRRLDQGEQRLQVAAPGAGTIFVDNNFAPLLCPNGGTEKKPG